MNLEIAKSENQTIAVRYSSADELEIIRRILFADGRREDRQWMPDERYSYVVIPPSGRYELNTLAYDYYKVVKYNEFIDNN